MRVAISENDISKYPNEEARLAAYRARQAKFFPKPVCAPVAPVSVDLPPAAEPLPGTLNAQREPTPLERTILAIVQAVAVRLNVSFSECLNDATNSTAQMARKVAAAVVVRRMELRSDDVAEKLGISRGAVLDGLALVDAAMREFAIPRACSLEQMLNLIFESSRVDLSAPRVTVEEIKRVTMEHFKVRLVDMMSPRRTANVVHPRQIAMCLARHLTLKSLPEIGRRFGGRDHTTVLHAIRKFAPAIALAGETIPMNAPIIDWVRAIDNAHDTLSKKRSDQP